MYNIVAHNLRTIAAALLPFALSAAAIVPAKAAEPTTHTCLIDGVEREYRLYLPDGLDDGAPLVFLLHGYGSSFDLDHRGFNEAADKYGFAVCYPQGTRDSRGKRCWNVGYPFQEDMTVDDVSFLCQLAARLQDSCRFSRHDTFCAGMSNGGEMCYLLAYTRPDIFAAVAPIAGLTMEWIYRKYDTPKAIPLFEIHGTEDRTSEWNGDLENSGGWGSYLPVPVAVGYWVAANRCTREEVDTLAVRRNPVIAHRFKDGRDGNEVWLYEIVGGKHSWATDDMDTADEVLKFFSKFVKRHLQ